MNETQDELRVSSKNEIQIYGDLDIIAKLKNLEKIPPLQEILLKKDN
mgnify:CR=1 FL=1|jgi:hypothetical protein